MTTLLALTVAAAIGTSAPAAAPALEPGPALVSHGTPAAPARPALISQAAAIAARPSTNATAGARLVPPGGDSLKNGAIIGGVVAGAGMGAFIYWLCNALDDTGGDQPCAGPALAWAGIAGAGGALVGAGVDALFDATPQARMKPRPGVPPRSVRPGVAVRWRF